MQQLYPKVDGPRYVKGHAISMAFIAMASVIYLSFWAWFRHLNQRKASGKEDHRIQGLREEEIEELGEHNPAFKYTY
ncbi:hypothetical protein AUP68_18054 [Ilyonectria robusta]